MHTRHHDAHRNVGSAMQQIMSTAVLGTAAHETLAAYDRVDHTVLASGISQLVFFLHKMTGGHYRYMWAKDAFTKQAARSTFTLARATTRQHSTVVTLKTSIVLSIEHFFPYLIVCAGKTETTTEKAARFFAWNVTPSGRPLMGMLVELLY